MEPTPHILIVDDDSRLRRGLSKFLGEQGLRVTMAEDGRDMRSKLAGARIDLIVLDVMMPGEDGLSLLRSLRAQNAVPVIMLTALAAETDRIVGLELGAEDYVCKPFSPRELLARIRVVLRRNDARTEICNAGTGYVIFLPRMDAGRAGANADIAIRQPCGTDDR